MTEPIFALIDANNFFVSCERIFRPDLIGKPVIVRSSNDGCVVARSNEAKRLGIPMGVPVFKIRHLIEQHHITEFSGSFSLYGDISWRLSECLRQFCPRLEIYSVDESFLDLSNLFIDDYYQWGRAVAGAVWRAIGIPVSVGIAPTKTLAKLASEQAKQNPSTAGVVSFLDASPAVMRRTLEETPIGDIWGIGRSFRPLLHAEGIATAWQLSCVKPARARQLMGIHGRQLVAELNGISCIPLEQRQPVTKSISRTRMFGHDTSDLEALESAIASLTADACSQLRTKQLVAATAGFFLTTNRNHPDYRHWQSTIHLSQPTADAGRITTQLLAALRSQFEPAQRYHRAGISLHKLSSADRLQPDLFGGLNLSSYSQETARLQAIDQLNARFGATTVQYGAENLQQSWRPRQAYRSPCYTTDWQDLPQVTIAT